MKYFIIFVLCSKVCGNVLKLDDSNLNLTPPLYDLDDWQQCRKQDDVYCVVDAVLINGDPLILNKLQAFSNETKRYNRTQIHRGVCVTRCQAEEEDVDFMKSAQICVNQSLHKYDFEVRVESVGWCSRGGEHIMSSSSGRALAVLCTALVAFACLATALHVLADSCVKADGNKYLLAFSMKRNWEILTYDRSKPHATDRIDFACIEGVRFFGMQFVIFSNVIFIYIYSYIDNPEFIENMYEQFGWNAVFNSPLLVQAFFSISGFLMTYSVLLNNDSKQMTIYKCIKSIINRWVRLTPMAMFALWFTIAWFPLLGSGPQWTWLVNREAADCQETWWYHVLYIHNYLPAGKFCMGHTWYLAVDMQLHILGVFLLFFLVKYPKFTMPLLLGLVFGSAIAAGLVTYWYKLTPIITAQTPEILRTMFVGSKIHTLVFLPFWMNFPGYVSGMSTAFILHHNQLSGVKINQMKWFNIIFHSSLALIICVMLVGTFFLSDSLQPMWISLVYTTLDRTALAVCFNVFLLGCFSKCKSVLKNMLEWRYFHILGRLSYCVFLMHFVILRLTFAVNTQLGHASILSMVSLLITTSVLTYAVSVPLCLLVELPAMQMWKSLTGDSEVRSTRTVITPPQPVVKPFDLVAHLRKRHDLC